VTAEFFCNGTEAYMEAYNIQEARRKTANTNASKLLCQERILKEIDDLIEFS